MGLLDNQENFKHSRMSVSASDLFDNNPIACGLSAKFHEQLSSYRYVLALKV